MTHKINAHEANTSVNIRTQIAGMELANPTVLASGISGNTKCALKLAAIGGAGALTIKSITAHPRKGHNTPIVATFEAGMLNAVGYPNFGIDEALVEFKNLDDFRTMQPMKVPVIGSAVGKDAIEFAELVSKLSQLDFAAIEIVLSCPHTPGYGTLAGHSTPEATSKITSKCRSATEKPLFVKLSPDAPGIANVAKSAEDAGADAITAVNTMGPGMLLDIYTAKPRLSFGMGGVSGYALRPVAMRCVYDIYKKVNIPIIGTGGVYTGKHAIEMMMAGAAAVGIGTAVIDRGIDVFRKVTEEMKETLAELGIKDVKEITGLAHK